MSASSQAKLNPTKKSEILNGTSVRLNLPHIESPRDKANAASAKIIERGQPSH